MLSIDGLTLVLIFMADMFGDISHKSEATSIEGCKISGPSSSVKVDCSHANLTTVPLKKMFDDVETSVAKELDFSYNRIRRIISGSFDNTPSLEFLDLSYNDIHYIEVNALSGLGNLRSLNLEWNKLTYKVSNYFPGLFSELKSLQNLNINGNNDNGDYGWLYPSMTLSEITSLENLYMDGIQDAMLDGDFLNLRNLTLFSSSGLNGYCVIGKVGSEFFTYLPYLVSLNISYCVISSIDPESFTGMVHLRILDLSQNPLKTVDSVFEALQNLVQSDIGSLFLNGVASEKDECNPLKGTHTRFLENTTLEQLHLADNNLTSIDELFFKAHLPVTMRYMSFRRNLLTSRTLTDQFRRFPNLHYVDFSHNHFTSFSYASLSNSYTVDFSNNNCFDLQDSGLPSDSRIPYMVRNLSLGNNYLGNALSTSGAYALFQQSENLNYLDLSNNNVNQLPKRLFQNNHHLQNINLSKNFISDWDIDLRKFPALEEIDLSENRLINIPQSVRELNFVQGMPRLYLSRNSFQYSCDKIDSLKWLLTHRDNVEDYNMIEIFKGNISYNAATDLPNILDNMRSGCADKSSAVVIGISVSVIVCITLLITVIIVYRYRWRVRYNLYYYYRKLKTPSDETVYERMEYKYDALVSYAHEDEQFAIKLVHELENHSELRLCLHLRDFQVGTAISDNICSAVHDSRSTILILSEHFAKSHWCMFELYVAITEVSQTKKNHRIIPILLDGYDVVNVSTDLRYVLRKYTTMHCPRNRLMSEDEEKSFWKKIRKAVCHNKMQAINLTVL